MPKNHKLVFWKRSVCPTTNLPISPVQFQVSIGPQVHTVWTLIGSGEPAPMTSVHTGGPHALSLTCCMWQHTVLQFLQLPPHILLGLLQVLSQAPLQICEARGIFQHSDRKWCMTVGKSTGKVKGSQSCWPNGVDSSLRTRNIKNLKRPMSWCKLRILFLYLLSSIQTLKRP